MRQARSYRVVLAVSLALALASCATSTPDVADDTTSATSPASGTSAQPQFLFMSSADSFSYANDSYAQVTQVRVSGPDGRQAQDVIPAVDRPVWIWSSDDASVMAFWRRGATSDWSLLPADIWVVGPLGERRLPVTPTVRPVAAVAADGHAVYATHGRDIVRYDVRADAVTTMCTRCVTWPEHVLSLAVSSDESRIAVSSFPHGDATIFNWSVISILDVRSGDVLWTHDYRSFVHAEEFIDDTSLLTTVEPLVSEGAGGYRLPDNHFLDIVSGIGSGHVADRRTGIRGHGPVTHVAGTWWYFRDGWDWVTSVLTSTDLTPAHETKVADRVDGTTSYAYRPLTSSPAIVATGAPGPVTIGLAAPTPGG